MLDACKVSNHVVSGGGLLGCTGAVPSLRPGALVQVSRMDRLAAGEYAGIITVGELRALGSIGLGTFDSLDGELVMLDGSVYRIAGDGSVTIPADTATVPFGNAWHGRLEGRLRLRGSSGFEGTCAQLDAARSDGQLSGFCIARVDGAFSRMLVRSVHAQEEPYAPLGRVLDTAEARFELGRVEGTIVAFYCPECTEGVAETGWHLHFVSADKTAGGHVLDLCVESADAAWGSTDELDILQRA